MKPGTLHQLGNLPKGIAQYVSHRLLQRLSQFLSPTTIVQRWIVPDSSYNTVTHSCLNILSNHSYVLRKRPYRQRSIVQIRLYSWIISILQNRGFAKLMRFICSNCCKAVAVGFHKVIFYTTLFLNMGGWFVTIFVSFQIIFPI